MLTEETVVDHIAVDAQSGGLSVRRATFILRDGVRLPHPIYHRVAYAVGDDVSGEDARVQAIAAAAWAGRAPAAVDPPSAAKEP